MRNLALPRSRAVRNLGTGGREDNISSPLFVDRQKKAIGWVLSAVCVTVLYLVQVHHDSQIRGNSGIVELREVFDSRCSEQCWYRH